MGVPTSEVGYASAMSRREDYEVRKGHVGHLKKNIYIIELRILWALNLLVKPQLLASPPLL